MTSNKRPRSPSPVWQKQDWTPSEWKRHRQGKMQEKDQARVSLKYEYEENGKFEMPVPPEQFLSTAVREDTEPPSGTAGLGHLPLKEREKLRTYLHQTDVDPDLFYDREYWLKTRRQDTGEDHPTANLADSSKSKICPV